jgi:predicted membrane channel-forming protein YqfA (hemolysin III family)
VAAFVSTLVLLPSVALQVQLAESLLVSLAVFCKYGLQAPRAERRHGGGDYWWPHCLWHLFIAMGQALLAAALAPLG